MRQMQLTHHFNTSAVLNMTERQTDRQTVYKQRWEKTGKLNLSATEIAQKQRHLHLLTRVRNNQPLSRPELAELEELKKTMDENTKAQRDKGTKAQSRESRASIAGAEIIESQDAAALVGGKNGST